MTFLWRVHNGRRMALLATLLLFCFTAASAQDDVEYRAEIGAGVGLTAYEGDFNNSIVKNLQPAGSVVFRRVLDPYSALRFSGMITRIKGEYSNANTVYPDLEMSDYSFTESLLDFSATYEYNFFPYGTGKEYRGAKRLTPFISLGIGMTIMKLNNGVLDYTEPDPHTDMTTLVTANVPLGLGVKYKVAPRWNLSLDWQMHFTFSDCLDGVKDPYRIKSSGLFKNTDCYSTLTVALTYSISPKCPTCHKDR